VAVNGLSVCWCGLQSAAPHTSHDAWLIKVKHLLMEILMKFKAFYLNQHVYAVTLTPRNIS
jgi:hypothetical protein